ncbi:MAG: sodium-dependent transporter [Lentisphaeria bacterium]|nr:sodium-dependent transporter [Lentisphaeria bacterium]
MSNEVQQVGKREHFSSSLGFVLAIAGSAIGLGNIWKFPFVTGMNGGGAFVLVYLLCIFFVGIPLMVSEMSIGRNTQKNPYGAFAKLFPNKKSRLAIVLSILTILSGIFMILAQNYGFGVVTLLVGLILLFFGFKFVGFVQVFIDVILLAYYSVIGGWSIIYMYKSFLNQLQYNTPDEAAGFFNNLSVDLSMTLVFQMIFLFACMFVLLKGVKEGIEKWSKILMPTMFFLLIALIINNLTLKGSGAGVKFFLYPDFSKLSTAGVLEALGHSFFTLSLGMGIVITYGSYLSKDQNLFKASLQTIFLDTCASLMAGLAIFPAVFAMGGRAAAGPQLIFEVLPATFNKFPGGTGFIWCGLFFLCLTIAALTSGMSLLEIPISYFMDQFNMKRIKAICVSMALVVALGVFASLSAVNWQYLQGLYHALVKMFGEAHVSSSFFNLLDTFASAYVLPLSGLMTALFVGWVWGTRNTEDELKLGAEKINKVLPIWAVLIRYIIPVVIVIIFLHGVNAIEYVRELFLN